MALPPLRVGDADGVDDLLCGDEWLEDKSMTLRLSFVGDCSGELDNDSVVADAAAAAKIEEVNDRIELATDFLVGVFILLLVWFVFCFSVFSFSSLTSFELHDSLPLDILSDLDGLEVTTLLLLIPLVPCLLSLIPVLLFLAVWLLVITEKYITSSYVNF